MNKSINERISSDTGLGLFFQTRKVCTHFKSLYSLTNSTLFRFVFRKAKHNNSLSDLVWYKIFWAHNHDSIASIYTYLTRGKIAFYDNVSKVKMSSNLGLIDLLGNGLTYEN